MAVKKTLTVTLITTAPKPPLVHRWNPPSHDGLLDTDVEEKARGASKEKLDNILWETGKFYKAMAKYIKTCLACRSSARRMGLPYGTKQEWKVFVDEVYFYMSCIESRMTFVLDELARLTYPSTKRKTLKQPRSSRPLKKRPVAE